MMVEAFSVRCANPDELDMLVVIDEAASELYRNAGLAVELALDHPFVVAEKLRWASAIEQRLAHVAVNGQDMPVGFATLRCVDGQPYLDQLAVLPDYMRRGVGTLLLNVAISWSAGRSLWLTTYSHFPWNRPYYEKHGFVIQEDDECGDELCAVLLNQRSALPDPDQRIAMVRRTSGLVDGQ